jgi:ubiquinone/menaquinone biosynthesis C-methylase UbiE
MNDLAERERNKYERMWDVTAYRNHAPGEALATRAFNEMGMRKGDKIIDFGCGTGRPAVQFQRMGAAVIGVDHATNCLDPNMNITFLQCCLWDMPPDLLSDYGYCTDVMEHIPPEKVDAVLSEIKRIVRNKVFFQIATFPDGMGKRIGETLHLSVHGPEWWKAKLSEHWGSVIVSGTRNCIAIVQ